MKSHRGEQPVMMDEPGCSGGQKDFKNGLASPCRTIAVYSPALYAEWEASERALDAAAEELKAATNDALRAGLKL